MSGDASVAAQRHRDYYVLELDTVKRTLRSSGYRQSQLAEAESVRQQLEAKHANSQAVDVVLVSANHIDEITKGYPNYRLDTTAFIQELRTAISEEVAGLEPKDD